MVVKKYTFKYNRIIGMNKMHSTIIQKAGKYEWKQMNKF